tara:strand:- start:2140 stop:2307 length:168 start_codon:yes stop_codon:yes gene_type:complete
LKLGEDFREKYQIKNTYFMKMDVFDLKFKQNNFIVSSVMVFYIIQKMLKKLSNVW